MPKRYIARKVTTSGKGSSEVEALRRELQTYLQQEITRLFNLARGDLERSVTQNLGGISARTMNVVASGTPASSGLGGFGGFGSTLTGAISRYARSRTRTRTETSAATETSRSATENQLYRESASQQAATTSTAAQSGGRNL